MSQYGVFYDPYFPVFRLNTGKYGPKKTSVFDTIHAVHFVDTLYNNSSVRNSTHWIKYVRKREYAVQRRSVR